MPYIKKENRIRYDHFLKALPVALNKGDLEYIIFSAMKKYMATKEFRYGHLHDTAYAAIHAGEEFKRLNLDKREDVARYENGDIK